jgi:hypothetical protein
MFLALVFSIHNKQLIVSDHAAPPSPSSSLRDVHRCIGSRYPTRQTLSTSRQTRTTSVKLTYLSVYDSRDGVSEYTDSPSPPSSFTYPHRWIGSRNATRQTLPTSPKLGLFVDSEIVLSTSYGKTRVFINKPLSTETAYQQDLIKRDLLSTRLIRGKVGPGIRGKVGPGMWCGKFNSTSNVLVCETKSEYVWVCQWVSR